MTTNSVSVEEKASMDHNEHTLVEEVAKQGHTATDVHGNSLLVFDAKQEAKLRLKIDLRVIPCVAILYLLNFIDRANIGNARLAGFERDLRLTGYQYNIVLTSFYIAYIVFEIPSNIVCKVWGPAKFIPAISFGFGLLSLCMAFVHNFSQACAVRFLLGAFEAGSLPGIAFYLSRWYRKSELAFRLALYIVTAPLAGAFGGLLASAILKIPPFGEIHTWKTIFFIEGLVTMVVSVGAWFYMTDSPATAGWLTEEEKDLAIARVKSENVGTTEVIDKLDFAKVRRGMSNPNTLAISWVFLLINVTVQGIAIFMPTIVRAIFPGRTVISQQLYTVPPYVVGAAFTLLFPYLSWKLDRRCALIMTCIPLVITGYLMFLASARPSVRYAACFLITSGAFSFAPLCNSQVSANLLSDSARSSGIGIVVMFGNIGGLISTWSFLPKDGPNFPIGNGLNFATSSSILITTGLLLLWMQADNKRRAQHRNVEQELAGLSQKEIQDLDWRHPAFRWRY